ncbi:hypothetical protein NE619_14980 [Anaerovorax odorimutans]|uniref:Uncharacterized protein n=1 Tax=Anaerovorax odorimutans TaxID=109327 RepID=A0ABT1RS61_9FIRM|nr:hypothetical protein [Anaerovorax odorimutans]
MQKADLFSTFLSFAKGFQIEIPEKQNGTFLKPTCFVCFRDSFGQKAPSQGGGTAAEKRQRGGERRGAPASSCGNFSQN